MPTKSIINLFQTQPKAVQDLVSALQVMPTRPIEPREVRGFLYPSANDSRDRWNEYVDAGESVGLLTRDPLEATTRETLDDETYGRLLRQRFRDEELRGDTNALVYLAYRAALSIQPDQEGGTPTGVITDRAEALATRALGPSTVRRYDSDKVRRWRAWITAAGLGFPGNRATTFVICPVIALRDELAKRLDIPAELPVDDFLTAFDSLPLIAGETGDADTLPVGTGIALRILEETGLLQLTYRPDSRRHWRLADRAAPISHVGVAR